VVEQDEGSAGDGADTAGVETDPSEGFEPDDEQGVRAFTDAAEAALELVVGLLVDGELAAGGVFLTGTRSTSAAPS
jgi:hypothetical protein